MDELKTFTSDVEIDNFEVLDDTIELKGFIEDVEPIKYVGPAHKPLLKVLICNGHNRRVQLLFWEKIALNYSTQVHRNKIIHIKYARGTKVNEYFIDQSLTNLCKVELNVSKSTEISIGDFYKMATSSSPAQAKVVSIEDVFASGNGLLCVEGYIKLPFKAISSGSSTHGAGVLTDGKKYRLPVRIANYQPNDDIKEKMKIKVTGNSYFDKKGVAYFQVADMSHVSVVPGSISEEEMRKGVATPKRAVLSEISLEKAGKRIKLDTAANSGTAAGTGTIVLGEESNSGDEMNKMKID